jgi:hypothetical protein
MTVLACTVPCKQGGTSVITLNWEGRRSGSNPDQAAFRIIRRVSGQADVVLPTAPNFVLGSDRDVRSWTFYDVNVPINGFATYVCQVMKINGGGTFFAMQIGGVHFRR